MVYIEEVITIIIISIIAIISLANMWGVIFATKDK
jgi:hypothetical protein